MASEVDFGAIPPGRRSVCSSSFGTSEVDPSRAAAALPDLPVVMSIISGSLLLREGLALLLASHLTFDLVGSYSTHPIPTAALPNPPGHVVLIDGSLGHSQVIHWTRYWRDLPNPPSVIAIELIDDVDTILTSIEAGATGYVLRGASSQSVALTIEAARCGTAFCSPKMTAQLFTRLARFRSTQTSPPSPLSLTAREREVLRYVTCHYSNQQIADAMVIEIRTVKHHVHNLLEKLNLRHRWEAAQVAAHERWFENECEVRF